MTDFIIRTSAKRFPPYVYGKGGLACLVHRVVAVKLFWVLRSGKRVFSHSSIDCACGQAFMQRKSQLCEIPNVDAIDCGRCWGNGPVFKWHDDYAKRREAKARLGCVVTASSR